MALVAPAVGRLADSSGHRRRSVLIGTVGVALSIGAMVFVAPQQPYLVLGAALLGIGTVAYEIATVGYNAMLGQVAPGPADRPVSAIGWAAGYFGGIVLLVVLLVLCIQDFGDEGVAGLLHLPSTVASGSWDVRVAIGIAAVWLAVSSVPLFLTVPEAAPDRTRTGGLLGAYRDLGRHVARLWRERRNVLAFLVASAVFRDGSARCSPRLRGIVAAQVFGFTPSQVILFAIAANVVAGIATFASGRLDDRFGSRAVITVSLAGLALTGVGVFLVGDATAGFWVLGLTLALFRRPGAVVVAGVPVAARDARSRGRALRPLRHDRAGGVVPRAGAVRDRGHRRRLHALRDHRRRGGARRGARAHGVRPSGAGGRLAGRVREPGTAERCERVRAGRARRARRARRAPVGSACARMGA